jgi:ketosteroid isomerase-like protein
MSNPSGGGGFAGRSDVVQDFFQRCFHGDLSKAVELLDPNVVYRVPGEHPLAGTFEGAAAVSAHIGQLLRETHHTVDALKWEDWMVGLDHLAGLVKLRAERHGVMDTLRAIFLVTMTSEGRIGGIELFFSDQAEVARFFR